MLNDFVRVSDAGRLLLNKKAIYFWGDERSVVEVKGWVTTLFRERGKIVPGSRREGHNIWTDTGREFLAMLMTYKANGVDPSRDDRIAYIGVGTGSKQEEPGVSGLHSPIEYRASLFLAPIDHVATDYPLRPTRTTVKYSRVFAEDELTFGVTQSILIGEIGLFTNGHQNTFIAGQRQREQDYARFQSPVAYKALVEPAEKNAGLEFQVDWEIRF